MSGNRKPSTDFETRRAAYETVQTADGSRCAQFEHTLVVTDRGAEVLTV